MLRRRRRLLIGLQELQVGVLLLDLRIGTACIVEELLVQRVRIRVGHRTLIKVVHVDAVPVEWAELGALATGVRVRTRSLTSIATWMALTCELLNIHHVLPDQAVHLQDVGVVLREDPGSVNAVVACPWTALEPAKSLKRAPKRRLELQCPLVAFDRLLVLELALQDEAE